jgi:hypothetical protein
VSVHKRGKDAEDEAEVTPIITGRRALHQCCQPAGKQIRADQEGDVFRRQFQCSPNKPEIHPVDQILATAGLLALGLQHVLVMYAGAVAVPLIMKLILLSSLRSPLD